jgi:3'-phosphoadenosine 5'-phosphosulfate sulfotransferase (PAPS reductase)/FAD synthetase
MNPNPNPPKFLISYSGGVGSWAATKRIVDEHGPDGVVLLFADTMMEDADLYRFLDETSAAFGIPITRIADGRTPWQVFEDVRMIGNSRIDPCSRVLKREILNKWRDTHCDPATTKLVFGIDWTESHRFARIKERSAPWQCVAPMLNKPYLSKLEMMKILADTGIKPPDLYSKGFAHNNCGGFCVKAGLSHFSHLLRTLPDLYRFHESEEQRLRDKGINGTILRLRRNDDLRPITLKEFRERIECETADFFPPDDMAGGCGCALPI